MYCATTNVYDIIIDQGATFHRVISLKSSTKSIVTLTGYSARMHIRELQSDTETVLSLSSPTNGLTVSATLGRVEILVTPGQTAALVAGDYVYDLELVSPTDEVTRVLQGNVKVRPEVTR